MTFIFSRYVRNINQLGKMLENVRISNPLVTQLGGRELFRELMTGNDLGTLVCVGKLQHHSEKS